MPTEHKSYQGFAQEMTYPEYVLLTDMPYDWKTSYTNYYKKVSDDEYEQLRSSDPVPNFASGDFYVLFNSQPSYTNPELHRFVDDELVPDGQDLKFMVAGTDSYRYVGVEDYYTLTTSPPPDWETNYTDYLRKDGEQYKYVTGTSAPPWEPDMYYSCEEIP